MPSRKHRILIVDDIQESRSLLTWTLEDNGYRVENAASAAEASQLIQTNEPPVDLILLDINMPDVDGLSFCRSLRGAADYKNIPIIFITALADNDVIQQAFAAGGNDYVRKPVAEEELLARVDMQLQLHQSRLRIFEMLNQLDIGALFINKSGDVFFANLYARTLLNQHEQIDASSWQKWFNSSDDDLAKLDWLLRESLAHKDDENPNPHTITLNVDRDGLELTLEVVIKPSPLADGNLLYLYNRTELSQLQSKLSQFHHQDILGESQPVQQLIAHIHRIANIPWNVLIQGETGTGKELVARSIHRHSERSDKPFIAINCAAFNEQLLANELFGHKKGAFTGASSDKKGLFQAADHGVLFLDEIGDLPLAMQGMLLRVLQEGAIIPVGDTRAIKVDVRVIAATHRNLKELVNSGQFRADLYYRLNVANILVPALRERSNDIHLLAKHFLSKYQVQANRGSVDFSPDVLQALESYSWPGNIRELEHLVQRMVLSADTAQITLAQLPEELQSHHLNHSIRSIDWMEKTERTQLVDALRRAGGNRSKAAKIFGVSRATFYRKLQSNNIRP